MTPIERAQGRAEALSTLGLRGASNFPEIRRAWRQRAFETHPDRMNGDQEAFMRAKAAFELLSTEMERKSADSERCSQKCRSRDRVSPRRPIRATETAVRIDTLTPEDQAECYALLAAKKETEVTDHIAELVQREGRHLVYIVASKAAIGKNRVALPAEILAKSRKVAPSLVDFEVTKRNVGDIVIPEATRLEVFPEARSVRIRFQSDLRCQ